MVARSLLLILAAASYSRLAAARTHSSADSLYIHSNDSFSLTLSAEHANKLHGRPGDIIDLDFILSNKVPRYTQFVLRFVLLSFIYICSYPNVNSPFHKRLV